MVKQSAKVLASDDKATAATANSNTASMMFWLTDVMVD